MNRSKTTLSKSQTRLANIISDDLLNSCRSMVAQHRKAICHFQIAALAAVGFGLSGSVLGEGTISIGAPASARVTLEVLIPNVVALQVGSTGSTIDTLTWDSTIEVGGTQISLTDQDWDGTTPDTTAPLPDGVTTSPDILENGAGNRWRARVRVFALGGDVTIASSASNGDFLMNSGGHQISLSDIDVRSPGNLPHPNSLNGGSSTVLRNGSGVVNRSGRWRYRINTSSTLAAGTYQSTITYTATIL